MGICADAADDREARQLAGETLRLIWPGESELGL
jgi:hypothetical protein